MLLSVRGIIVPSQEIEQSCFCVRGIVLKARKLSDHVFVLGVSYQARKVSDHVFVC